MNRHLDRHAGDEHAFCWSCRNGHLTIAQWLYSLGDVNIHADNEHAFRWSCRNGHLDVAKWLYSLGNINIHDNNGYIFKNSAKNILGWLNNLPQKN